MIKGNDNMRRNLTLLMNKIAKDISKDIAKRINSSEPAFAAKAEKRDSDEMSVNVVIKGQAELDKGKDQLVDEIIDNAIKNTLSD